MSVDFREIESRCCRHLTDLIIEKLAEIARCRLHGFLLQAQIFFKRLHKFNLDESTIGFFGQNKRGLACEVACPIGLGLPCCRFDGDELPELIQILFPGAPGLEDTGDFIAGLDVNFVRMGEILDITSIYRQSLGRVIRLLVQFGGSLQGFTADRVTV